MKSLSGIEILLSSGRGVYIPQNFVECFDASEWGIEEDDKNILLSGPEHEEYWDAWDSVLSAAEYDIERDGVTYTYTLHQDGDLFAYCPELMTTEEWVDFGFDIHDKPDPMGWCKLDVCGDCIMYLANAELPPDTSEERDKEIIEGVGSLHHPAADGTPLGFSYSSCDCCRSPLGGDRYLVYEKEREGGSWE